MQQVVDIELIISFQVPDMFVVQVPGRILLQRVLLPCRLAKPSLGMLQGCHLELLHPR